MTTITVARLISVFVIASALVAGCDRDGGTAGIDGTGAPRPIAPVASNTLAYGYVENLGTTVWVNDVSYDISAAVFTIDGRLGSASDIEIGDIVLVAGRTDPAAPARSVAERITFDDAVEGPIGAIDLARSSLVALGQTVRVAPDTAFDESVSQQSLAGLAAGDVVEVSGFRSSSGEILATRIEKKPTGSDFETTGIVTSLDGSGKRFNINALVVDYSVASMSFAGRAIANGDIVEVKGTPLLGSAELIAASVELRVPVSGNAGDHVDMEGYVTSYDAENPQTLGIAGMPVRTTNETVIEDVTLTLDSKVEVKGSLDSSGAVVARNMKSGYPGPTSGPHTVVGQVFDPYSSGIAADVNLWIQQGRMGYSYWWANGRLSSDALGRFTAPNVPTSQITVLAWRPGFVQPCAVIADVRDTGALQVEMLPESALEVANPPRPQSARGLSLTGVIFETVNGNRQPVSGALLWAEHLFEVGMATTRSDPTGGFFLCNLPRQMWMYVDKRPDYALEYLGPIDPAQSPPLEIELHRH
jgi:hypothetical protein